MRLLNSFFSRSKREQDKPIRDKLKDSKHPILAALHSIQ